MRNYHKRLFEESEIRIKETENKRKEAENQAAILNSPRQTRRHLPSLSNTVIFTSQSLFSSGWT